MNTARLCLSVALMAVAVPGWAVTTVSPLAPGAAPAAAAPIEAMNADVVEFVPQGNDAAFVLLPLRNASLARSLAFAPPVIDNGGLQISSVPDPGIWMMGLIGLGIVGTNMRARQRIRSVFS